MWGSTLMRIAVLLFLFCLSLSRSVLAQVPVLDPDKKMYIQLLNDLYDEVMTMDAIKEPVSDRMAMISQLKFAMTLDDPNSFKFSAGQSWSNIWPVSVPLTGRQSLRKSFTEVINLNHPGLVDDHSIANLSQYIEARLGLAATDLIRKELVVPVVLGGSAESISQLLNVEYRQIYKLPSFYESWGISKYFVGSSNFVDQKARLVFVVPPAHEYLEHYQYMLSNVTGRKELVTKCNQDYQVWKKDLANDSRAIAERLGGRFDYVTLGYFNQWIKGGSDLTGKSFLGFESQVISKFEQTAGGAFGQVVQLYNPKTGQSLRILALGHNRTIWGEASAALIEGVLPLKPQGIIFLGSAGALSSRANVYDLTVPARFRTKSNQVSVDNFLNLAQGSLIGSDSNVVFNITHGNTSSPAAQTRTYIQRRKKSGEDTIDVEQSLIAQAVEKYNRQNKVDIKFGAINLVTDKPFGEANHDLDKIDHQRKSQSRISAVRLATQAIVMNQFSIRACGKVH